MAKICFIGDGDEFEVVRMAACAVGSHSIHLLATELAGDPAPQGDFFVVGAIATPQNIQAANELLRRLEKHRVVATEFAPPEAKELSSVCLGRGGQLYLGIQTLLGCPNGRRPTP